MPFTKTCKLVALGALGVSAILVLVILYSFSPRLCPNNGELMHRPTNSCYPKESKGPCTNNLILLGDSDRSQYGECSCPYTQFNRTMLFHKELETCYFVFTQAYCPTDQWLTLTKNGSQLCEENKCLQHSVHKVSEDDDSSKNHTFHYHDNIQWVPIKGGGCARLGFHEEGCPENSVIRFHKDYILPSCFTPPIRYNSKIGSIGVPASNCRLGSYPSIMGKCQPQFAFDFD